MPARSPFARWCACRFFGVAESSIQDIDILIERPGGALVGEDKTIGPVAIIESEKLWCIDRDHGYRRR